MEYGGLGTNDINTTESVHSVRNVNRDSGKQRKKKQKEKKQKKKENKDILELHKHMLPEDYKIDNVKHNNDEDLIMKGQKIDVVIQ